MTFAEKLAGATKNKTVGNHFVTVGKQTYKGNKVDRVFSYHFTPICFVDDKNKKFWLDKGGYDTRSTNSAIDKYRAIFTEKGYTNVNKIKVFKYE